ncbi:hypothetical protein HDU84_003572 [Entophlyctis sp. JEL0112]|nr:hypothetical protein HDU84_003572 [Entophlyctis sp. JEL0112]
MGRVRVAQNVRCVVGVLLSKSSFLTKLRRFVVAVVVVEVAVIVVSCGEATRDLARARMVTSNRRAGIGDISDELLIYVVANLDPVNLLECAGVCKRWNRVVGDDSCWRRALACYLGGVLPVRYGSPTSTPNANTWQSRRSQELETGVYHAVQAFEFDPRIGSISSMKADFDNDRLLVGSLEKGIVSICRPSTGKVERELVYFNSDLEARPISALLIEKSRVICGHFTGRITVVSQFIAKPATSHNMIHLPELHSSPVTALASFKNIPHVIASGSMDGCVRIWDLSCAKCVAASMRVGRKIKHISLDSKNRLVACDDRGSVAIWDLNPNILLNQQEDCVTLPDPDKFVHNTNDSEPIPIHTLIHDFLSGALVTMVQNQPSSESIRLWSLQPRKAVARFVPAMGGSLESSSVVAVQWDRPRAGTSAAMSLLASVHSDGSLLLWHIPESSLQQSSRESAYPDQIQPYRRILAPHTVACISATIVVDPFKIVVAAAGAVRLWDATTGVELRSPNIRRGGDFGIRHWPIDGAAIAVATGTWRIVAANVSGYVRSWDFSAPSGGLTAVVRNASRNATPGKGKGPASNRAGGSGIAHAAAATSPEKWFSSPKSQIAFDVKNETRETQRELNMERKEDELQRQMWRRINGTLVDESRGSDMFPSSDSLTEQEMIEIALMMSKDEALLENGLLDSDIMFVEEQVISDAPEPEVRDGDSQSSHGFEPASQRLSFASVVSASAGASSTMPLNQSGNVSSSSDQEDEELQYVLRLSLSEQ